MKKKNWTKQIQTLIRKSIVQSLFPIDIMGSTKKGYLKTCHIRSPIVVDSFEHCHLPTMQHGRMAFHRPWRTHSCIVPRENPNLNALEVAFRHAIGGFFDILSLDQHHQHAQHCHHHCALFSRHVCGIGVCIMYLHTNSIQQLLASVKIVFVNLEMII